MKPSSGFTPGLRSSSFLMKAKVISIEEKVYFGLLSKKHALE
jgi:hypothetical protein